KIEYLIVINRRRRHIVIQEVVPLALSAPALAGFTSSSVHQNPAHRLGGGGKKVPTAVPTVSVVGIDQPDVRFMNQSGGLQCLARLLLRQPSGGEFAQLVIYQRQELLGGSRIARIDRVQNLGDFVHRSAAQQLTSWHQSWRHQRRNAFEGDPK